MTDHPSAPTLYDVAREAGVSLATASRVVNGSTRQVAESYRTRVMEAAARIGYTTNLSAQAMARGASRIAALLVSDIADPFFSTLASGVARAAEREGLLVTIAVTERDPQRELALVRELRGLRPQLLVLAGSRFVNEPGHDALARELDGYRAGGGRVVLIGQNEFDFASIQLDNAGGAEALGRHLGEAGFRKVAIAAGPADLVTARLRVEGFRRGLAAFGVTVPDHLVLAGEFSRDAGADAARRVVEHHLDEVELLFAVNDVMAIGALTALRDAGVSVPGQIAVAGFDDIEAAKDTVPALTTVRVELEALGQRAVELAMGDDDGEIADETFATAVVARASTAR